MKTKEARQCRSCGSEGNLMICTKCRLVDYCGVECQTQDWKAGENIGALKSVTRWMVVVTLSFCPSRKIQTSLLILMLLLSLRVDSQHPQIRDLLQYLPAESMETKAGADLPLSIFHQDRYQPCKNYSKELNSRGVNI